MHFTRTYDQVDGMPFFDSAPLSIKSNKKDKIIEPKVTIPIPTPIPIIATTGIAENTEISLNPSSSSSSSSLTTSTKTQGNNVQSVVSEKLNESSSDSRVKSKVQSTDERTRRIEACRFLARKILKRCDIADL